MKILFLSAANSVHTVKWVNAFAKRGHEVHLVYNAGHDPGYDTLHKKVELYRLKYSGIQGYYLNAKELKKIKEETKPDIINVHYASGYGTLARRAKIGEYLLSVWGSDVYDFPYKNRMNRRILTKNIESAKRLASTSYCMAEQLQKVIQKKVDVVITPFGVDITKFNPELYVSERKKLIIGCIKLLAPNYGLTDLVDAAKILFEQLPGEGKDDLSDRIEFHIYGDGEQKEELAQKIKQLELDKKVFLKGKIPNKKVPGVLSGFTIFCAPSYKESFGVAAIEAMAMEIPVIVSDAEGFREVAVDNLTGKIVKSGDVEGIAWAIKELLLNKEEREKLGINGRKRVKELYDWEKNVDNMENIYREMLNNKI